MLAKTAAASRGFGVGRRSRSPARVRRDQEPIHTSKPRTVDPGGLSQSASSLATRRAAAGATALGVLVDHPVEPARTSASCRARRHGPWQPTVSPTSRAITALTSSPCRRSSGTAGSCCPATSRIWSRLAPRHPVRRDIGGRVDDALAAPLAALGERSWTTAAIVPVWTIQSTSVRTGPPSPLVRSPSREVNPR